MSDSSVGMDVKGEGIDLEQFDDCTPGPWRVGENPGNLREWVHSTGYPASVKAAQKSKGGVTKAIADVVDEKNARLIAAAPQLLAELAESRRLLCVAKEEGECAQTERCLCACVLRHAEHANAAPSGEELRAAIEAWHLCGAAGMAVAGERLAKVAERSLAATADEPLDSQIDRLAKFIMANIPGEPSRNEGAVDTAIRLLGERATAPDGVRELVDALEWIASCDFTECACAELAAEALKAWGSRHGNG